MMSDHAWMELCEVSTPTIEEFQASDTVCLQFGKSRTHPELTTLILRAVPSSHLSDYRTVYVHPLLYEFLTKSASREAFEEHDDQTTFLAPLPLHEYCTWQDSLKHGGWTVSRVGELVDLPTSSRISVTCIYHEPSGVAKSASLERQMSVALEGRLIRPKAMLAVPTLSGVCLVTVERIEGDEIMSSTVYRVGSDVVLDVNFIDTISVPENPTSWDRECSGYDELLHQLITLSQLTGVSAPSGVLLTGCSGVGKSRLASCLAHHTSKSHNTMFIHCVSAQDLLIRASWATESDLLELLLPPTTEDMRCLLVLDDLHILENEDDEDLYRDPELLLVHNSILVALDRVSCASYFILGVCRAASQLPKEFVRIGRLEKEISMPAPTQVQREEILASILNDVTKHKRHRWAESLASQTAGFVALDLRRLCADAWTRAWSRSQDNVEITWYDLREAAHTCVPSQLAELDVTKTAPYPEEDVATDMLKVHKWSWRAFGGYDDVKKRLFRTVVMPWRRFISVLGQSDDENRVIQDEWITPPSGVLFYGPPGVGKTFAASCLASSLGLHVIKVRASDVLNQWLGGSEAAIRSLFARARSASPCILFFDEIDAIASNREDDGAADVTSRVLTTFLNEMDGISSGGNAIGGVLVVACTNRLEALDAALLRPGRLDEHVLLEMPVMSDVHEILKLYLSKVPLHENVSANELSELFVELNASSADIKGICRDACSRAIRDKTRPSSDLVLSRDDLLAAICDWRK